MIELGFYDFILTEILLEWRGCPSPRVFNRWKKRFGVPIYQVFGSTEVGFVAMSHWIRNPSLEAGPSIAFEGGEDSQPRESWDGSP